MSRAEYISKGRLGTTVQCATGVTSLSWKGSAREGALAGYSGLVARHCRSVGIKVPILPGIMPIMTYGGFKRMTAFCKTRVPKHVQDTVEAIKDNDEAVKVGVHLCDAVCLYSASRTCC